MVLYSRLSEPCLRRLASNVHAERYPIRAEMLRPLLFQVLADKPLAQLDIFLLGVLSGNTLVDDLLPSLALGLALHKSTPVSMYLHSFPAKPPRRSGSVGRAGGVP